MVYFQRYLQKPMEETTLLIDADLYLYRACAAAEESIDWGDDIWSLATNLKDAKKIFQESIDAMCEYLQTGHFICCLSDKDNFRKDVDPSYKGGRKKTRKPVGYSEMVKWVKETYVWHSEPLLEADDVMGILSTCHPNHTIICSDDKDMKSVPGRLYKPMTGELLVITEAEADLAFYSQVLTGDPTDGYSGCPKVGKVSAERILGNTPSWNLVVNTYAKQQLNELYALNQARLARILRCSDWDIEKSIIKLWEPYK